MIPSNYKKVPTDDGSFTLYSEAFGEACHSLSGAKIETQENYIKGCQLFEKFEHFPNVQILEVGFGLGIGFQETLLFQMENFPHSHFEFLSLEIDPQLIRWSIENLNLECDYSLKENLHLLEGPSFKLQILEGDAPTVLPAYLQHHPSSFHAIYQDAFSPRVNLELWSKDWFSLLKTIAHSQCILSTYSVSGKVRRALTASGWKVEKHQGFGKKKQSLRARPLR